MTPLYPYTSFKIRDLYKPENIYFFNSGSAALFFVVLFIKSKYKDSVFLLPAYTCPSVVNVLVKAKVVFDFVDLNESLDFDLNDLKVVVKKYINKKVILIPTSLFGAKIRNYKSVFEEFIIIEDMAQSYPDLYTEADFRIFSFGKGKMISSYSGGALLTNYDINKIYTELIVIDDFLKSFFLANLTNFILKYFYKLIEISPLNPEKNEHFKLEDVYIYRLSNMKKKWILTSIEDVDLSRRVKNSNYYLETFDKNLLFNLSSNIPYLRMPVKGEFKIKGSSKMKDYRYTYEIAKQSRGKDLKIAKILAYNSTFLPTHDLVEL